MRSQPESSGRNVEGVLSINPDDLRPGLNLTPQVERFEEYVRALEGFGTADRAVWDRSRRTLDALPAGAVTAEERALAQSATNPAGANARQALARKGRLYRLGALFTGPYQDREQEWWQAWREIESMGPEAMPYIADVMLRQLLQPVRLDAWPTLRGYYARTGTVGMLLLLETIDGMAAAAAQHEMDPAEDPLVQCLAALLQFEVAADPHVSRLAGHESKNVRKALARAIGEADRVEWFRVLERLHADPAWEVRGAVLLALGKMTNVREPGGALALESLRSDPEPAVREIAVRTVGYLHVREAVPELIALVGASPDDERAGPAMDALSRITFRRFTRREQWLAWNAQPRR